MVKSKKLFSTLIMAILSCIIFCFIQFHLNMNIKIINSNWWIKHHHYEKNNKIAYIITETEHEIVFKAYVLDEKVPTEIRIDQNTNFILSLHSNPITPFRWRITNEFKENSLLYIKDEYMQPISYTSTLFLLLNPKKGENWQRLNYYFKNINGNEIVHLQNSHIQDELKDRFQIRDYTLKIVSN